MPSPTPSLFPADQPPPPYHPYQICLHCDKGYSHLPWTRPGLGTTLGLGWIAPITSPAIIGRSDFNNRFNNFDNQRAQPSNRMWFVGQFLDAYNIGVSQVSPQLRQRARGTFANLPSSAQARIDLARTEDLLGRRNEALYRIGAEVAVLDGTVSMTFQGMYVTGVRTIIPEDFWEGPFFQVKCLMYCRPGTLVSSILGYEAVISVSPGEIRGNRERLYPGVLFYHEFGDFVFQGGAQLGIPLGTNDVVTADGVLSLGYWLYRHPFPEYGVRQLITALVPQVEVLGQHVLGDPTINNAFDIRGLQIRNPSPVYDFTIGLRIMVQNLQLVVGWSVPISGDEIRKDEFIGVIGWNF